VLKSSTILPIVRFEVLYLRHVLVAAAIVAIAQVADAQIYTWRDASGSLMMSDSAPADTSVEVRKFKVARASEPILVTKSVSNDYRDTYDDLIVEHARARDLRPDLVRAVVQVESGYNPLAVSPKGAMGLMQLMPTTASLLGVRSPFDPEENIRGGTTYLRQLLDRFQGNEELALAAYNAGPMAVDRYGNKVPPYQETRDYVRKVKTQTTVATATAGRPARQIYYKMVEVVDGRTVVRYSDKPPASGPYSIVDPSRY
jgi:soluble lytic murein transglycosylase-like protein